MRYANSLLIAIIVLLMSACSYTPEERVEKTVKQYVEAMKKHDWSKQSTLTYDRDVTETIEVTEDDDATPLEPTLKIDIEQIPVVKEDSKLVISSVREIYSNPSANNTDSEVTEVPVTETPEEVVDGPSISWPSDIWSAYSVEAYIGDKPVQFIVVQIGEKEFKIYSTKGLYEFNLNKLEGELKCAISLSDAENDEANKECTYEMANNFRYFDLFSTAVASNDTVKIYRLFPKLKKYAGEYAFKGKPIYQTYTQQSSDGKKAYIACTDSTRFVIEDGRIVDCRGIINSAKEEAAVTKLGETPKSKSSYNDIEYKNVLTRQAENIQVEKARKEKAASYKAQGVALISSHFSSNGDGAKGVEFSALNTSNKTAKYIIMEVVGYNSVDDPVWSDGYLKRCRGIGPIAPGEGGQWNFDNIWERGDLVKSYEIKSLIIQFTDGTSKSVKLPRSLPSDWRNWLY